MYGFPTIDNHHQEAKQSLPEDLSLFGLAQFFVDVRAVVQQGQGKPGRRLELRFAVASENEPT